MGAVFKMIDVGAKPITQRRAVARGEIQLSEKVRCIIEEKKVPKGDVLSLAEVAGIMGAKRTSDILPLCHPLTLDAVRVQCEVDSERNCVVVTCEACAQGRTGVEMEALSGVSAALLCIYDLTKGLDKGAVISGILLEHKEGGKSGQWWHTDFKAEMTPEVKDLTGFRSAVLTVSDSCSRAESEDISGALLASYLKSNGAELCDTAIIPDNLEEIRSRVDKLALKQKVDLILVTGGTGLGPRDLTPEAIAPLWTKSLPGFGELFRSRGLLNTSRAWLSRAAAGLVGNTLVVLLPGSPSGVKDGIAVLDHMIPHMISMIRGGKH